MLPGRRPCDETNTELCIHLDSSPLPFRGGDGGGEFPPVLCSEGRPHPNPSPEGEGLMGPGTRLNPMLFFAAP